MQSAIATAATELHVGLEVEVNVLVANDGQVPLMRYPALASPVATVAGKTGVGKKEPVNVSAIEVPEAAIVRPELDAPPAV